MKKYCYHVKFDLVSVHYRTTYHWQIDVEADNQKEAKAIAQDMWYSTKDKHMFHLEAKRFKDGDEFQYHWFKEVGRTHWTR